MRGIGVAPGGSVVDTLADEPVEAIYRKTPPGNTGSKDNRPRPDDVLAIEENFPRDGIESSNRARYEDLGPEPPPKPAAPEEGSRRPQLKVVK